jgi:thiamine phosphate synthase YjbQ (UPF0047 family)
MRSHTVYKTFNTKERREFVRITQDVQAAVDESGIKEGMVLVSAMHITAAVWVNDHNTAGRSRSGTRLAASSLMATG